MIAISRGFGRNPSGIRRQLYAAQNSDIQLFRTYSTTKSRPYKPPTSKSISKSTSPSNSPPIPLQSILPSKPTISTPSPSLINPPQTTHPPPLTLPSRTHNSHPLPFYKYYYFLGRAYATFYKTGLKSIWTSYRSARALPHSAYAKSRPDLHEAVHRGLLSRADLQLIRRAKSNVYRLPPFVLLFMICGEFTPLVIIFVTGLVPRGIWIPKQVEGSRRKAEERRHRARKESGIEEPLGKIVAARGGWAQLDVHDREMRYQFLARSLGLYPSWWDRYFPSLVPSQLVQRKVERKLRDLEIDDFAIRRDGGVKAMSAEEVTWACEERGIDVVGREEGELRRRLEEWMKVREERKSKGE